MQSSEAGSFDEVRDRYTTAVITPCPDPPLTISNNNNAKPIDLNEAIVETLRRRRRAVLGNAGRRI
jgi:hypothetical protein